MDDLLGNAVRFGVPGNVMAVGEGIETILSLRCVLPDMAMAAALSANHLAAILFPDTLRRLYIVRDADAAGNMALAALTERAEAAGIEALALSPRMGDFNEDLHAFGLGALRPALPIQLAPQDVVRFGDRCRSWAVMVNPARPMPDKAAPAFKAIAAPRPAPLRAGVLG